MNRNEKFLIEAEKRFSKVAGIKDDLSVYPLTHVPNIQTNKEKSKEFSEVFTPLWLVDQMIEQVNLVDSGTTTIDLCAGYGQFSIRLMRHFYNIDPNFNVKNFLEETHAFSELQLSSCWKLLLIFSRDINLFIGDSTYLNRLPKNAKGIWVHVEKYGYWVCLTQTVAQLISHAGKPVKEDTFVRKMEELISNLNAAYDIIKGNTMLTLEQIKAHPKLRLEAIHQLNMGMDGLSLQSVDTPPSVVDEMLDKVEEIEKKSIAVAFNCEIIEPLIHKKRIDPKQITFAIDFGGKLKAQAMEKMYGVNTILFNGEDKGFLFLHQGFKGRKFDVCLSNPPYHRGLDLKILQALMGNGTSESSLAKEYVFVHPSTWLLDQKGKSGPFNSVKNLLNKKLRSVKLFNGNAVFGVELFVPCVITHIDISYNSSRTDVILFDENFTVDSINDITKFGIHWKSIVEPFMLKIEQAVNARGHIWSHNTKTIEFGKIYCQTAAIRGDVNDRNKKSNATNATREIVKDNFYTMLKGRDIEECKGIREPRLNKPGGATPTFGFDSEVERDNFLHYLNTDFARFCLAIYKIGQHMENGEMELIPWLDFTQAWDDEKLFDHFDIDRTTQNYIRSFLPDYYGIRDTMDFVAASIKVLRQNNNNPMSPKEIWECIEKAGLAKSDGKTPWATIGTKLGARSQHTNYSTKTLANQNPKGDILFENEDGKFKLIDDVYTTP
jgi:hypothetical protein